MDENLNQNQNIEISPNPDFTPPTGNPIPPAQFSPVVPNNDYNLQTDFAQQAPQTAEYNPGFVEPQFNPEPINVAPAQFDAINQNQGGYPEVENNSAFQQQPPQNFNQNPYGAYPDEQAPSTQPTFQAKKTGNRIFFIIAGVVIVLLIAGLGFLFYSNYQTTKNTATNTTNTTNTTPTTNINTSTASTFNNSLTGGPTSPATLARKYDVTEIPADWILSRFTSTDRDASGKCTNDKVCGAQADPDNDNLTNLEEYNFQTDPLVNDTDKDGLADGDEVYIYYTDPIKADTDNDSFKDGSEMSNCYDPISSSSAKADKDRLNKIASAVGLKKIKEPTITTLKAAGATAADLDKGYVELKCNPPAAATTTGTTDGTSTTAPATSSSTQTTTTTTTSTTGTTSQ